MSKYTIGRASVMDLDLESHNLFVLLQDKLLSFHLDEYYLAGKINEYPLPSNIYTSIKCKHFYVCLYSSQSLLVLKYAPTQQCILQVEINELMYVAFNDTEILLICSGSTE